MIKTLKQNKKYFIRDYDSFRKKFYEEGRKRVYITDFYQFKNKKPVKLISSDLCYLGRGDSKLFHYSIFKFEKQKNITMLTGETIFRLFVSYFEEYNPFVQEELEV